jgi:hypothetical protein
MIIYCDECHKPLDPRFAIGGYKVIRYIDGLKCNPSHGGKCHPGCLPKEIKTEEHKPE